MAAERVLGHEAKRDQLQRVLHAVEPYQQVMHSGLILKSKLLPPTLRNYTAPIHRWSSLLPHSNTSMASLGLDPRIYQPDEMW